MATGSGAFGAKCGFNQSGGGYFVALEALNAKLLTLTPGTGSGGAATVGTFAVYNWAGDAGAGSLSSLVAVNKVIKDMGKTVVSAGRTFRKFQAIAPLTASATGVTGQAASATNPGYLTGYLELTREGSPAAPAAIARYA